MIELTASSPEPRPGSVVSTGEDGLILVHVDTDGGGWQVPGISTRHTWQSVLTLQGPWRLLRDGYENDRPLAVEADHLKPMSMSFGRSGRGLSVFDQQFDLDHRPFHVQESSLATEPAVRLITDGPVHLGVDDARELARRILWLCDNHYQTREG